MLGQCHFPEIDEPFATALRQATAYAIENYNPIGIIGAGSVMRGEGDITSDIDMYVIFEGDYRILIHKMFNGVPCQLFCNPPRQVLRYFVQERGRLDSGSVTAHMVGTGHVILDRDPRIEELRKEALATLKLPPQPDEDMLQLMRYHALSAVENMQDVIEHDPDMAMIEICNALPKMLNYHFLKQRKPIPRHKDIMQHIRQDDPDLAQLIHELFTAEVSSRYDILRKIADKTIEVQALFEYSWRDDNI